MLTRTHISEYASHTHVQNVSTGSQYSYTRRPIPSVQDVPPHLREFGLAPRLSLPVLCQLVCGVGMLARLQQSTYAALSCFTDMQDSSHDWLSPGHSPGKRTFKENRTPPPVCRKTMCWGLPHGLYTSECRHESRGTAPPAALNMQGLRTCLVCSLTRVSTSLTRCSLSARYFSCSAAYSSCRPRAGLGACRVGSWWPLPEKTSAV